MARMGDIEAEALAALRQGGRLVEDLFRHTAADAAPQQPVFTPATMAATAAATQEEPMSVLDDIEGFIGDVREIGPEAIADVKALGAAAIADLKAVKANPETADVLADLSKLAALAPAVGIPGGVIAGVAGGIKTLLSLYAPQPEQPAQPAVPAQ